MSWSMAVGEQDAYLTLKSVDEIEAALRTELGGGQEEQGGCGKSNGIEIVVMDSPSAQIGRWRMRLRSRPVSKRSYFSRNGLHN